MKGEGSTPWIPLNQDVRLNRGLDERCAGITRFLQSIENAKTGLSRSDVHLAGLRRPSIQKDIGSLGHAIHRVNCVSRSAERYPHRLFKPLVLHATLPNSNATQFAVM